MISVTCRDWLIGRVSTVDMSVMWRVCDGFVIGCFGAGVCQVVVSDAMFKPSLLQGLHDVNLRLKKR